MQIRKLNTGAAADVRKFVDFPFKLYYHHPQWVPPLVSGVELAMNRQKHPFYRHSDADFFVVEEGKRTLGQVAVLANCHYNDYHHSKTAFFYYFDAVDDTQVAQVLLDAAADWARSRGMDRLVGPKGFMRADGAGVLIDGFDHRAAPGATCNYPYYQRLFELAGFEKELDYFSGYLPGDYDLPERFYQVAERVKERRGFWVKSFRSKAELYKWIPKIQKINNEAFSAVWGYYPLDDSEAQLVGRQLLTIGDPHYIKLVMQEDEVAGFIFAFPDVSEALQKAQGRLFPLGWVHLLSALKKTPLMVVNGVGLLPKYQGLGANTVLYTEMVRTVKTRKVEGCDVSYVAETNLKSMADMAGLGVQWYKQHRIYRKAL